MHNISSANGLENKAGNAIVASKWFRVEQML